MNIVFSHNQRGFRIGQYGIPRHIRGRSYFNPLVEGLAVQQAMHYSMLQ
ncbi:hypothetical protein [Budvicia aquatica]|nr:hypothetical protein [Budvicia aquatica]